MHTSSEENHLAGIGWMLLTMALFVSMDTVVKYLTGDFSSLQIVWARFFFHMVWISLFLRKMLFASFASGNYKLQLLRSTLLVTTTTLFFTGLRSTELSSATAIMFLSPIFVTLLAIPILGEKVGIRRVAGVLIGFLGAIVIIHPRAEDSLISNANDVATNTISWLPELGHVLIICAALSNALYQLMTRKLRTVDSPTTTLLYSGVVGAIVMSLWAPVVWRAPVAFDWILISYSSLLWATLLGYLVFNALPDRWTLIGASLIISSGLYISYREHVVSRTA